MDRWVFIHVMKTAGTSFRKMLEETPSVTLYPTKDELDSNPKRWYLTAPELLARIERGEIDLSQRQFVCGHYAAGLGALLPGTWRTVTFLRDPVRRSLSMISHRHRTKSRFARFLKPNVAKMLEDERFVANQLRDYQTRVFAVAPTHSVNSSAEIDDAAFARAKSQLMDMDMVGLTEQFAASVALFSTMSGIQVAPPQHTNKSHNYKWTEDDIARVRALVPRDIELYEVAREKLRSQLAVAA